MFGTEFGIWPLNCEIISNISLDIISLFVPEWKCNIQTEHSKYESNTQTLHQRIASTKQLVAEHGCDCAIEHDKKLNLPITITQIGSVNYLKQI